VSVKVVVESPLRATDAYSREQFRRYWQFCCRDALERGEDVYSSHWLADILDDDNPRDRARGIACGLNWSAHCNYAVFYIDLGWSPGMVEARKFYDLIGKRIEKRQLGYAIVKIINDMADYTSDSAPPENQDLTEFA
jgi:hypothetical protein